MSSYVKCETCRQCRWQVYVGRFVDDVYQGEWRPFDRGCWDAYGKLIIDTAMARGVLKPCGACNNGKRPPWSKSFLEDEAPITGPAIAAVDVNGAPF